MDGDLSGHLITRGAGLALGRVTDNKDPEGRGRIRLNMLALDVDPRTLLSADEPAQHGFDNVASVLSVSPALLEDYLSAASTVSRLAVGSVRFDTTEHHSG